MTVFLETPASKSSLIYWSYSHPAVLQTSLHRLWHLPLDYVTNLQQFPSYLKLPFGTSLLSYPNPDLIVFCRQSLEAREIASLLFIAPQIILSSLHLSSHLRNLWIL
jgi:hypothetical protein